MILQGNVARMSLEKDGSKLVENCVKMIGRIHTLNLTQAQSLLRILDELINLPIYLPQFTYAFDQVFFSDLLTNKYSNYVVQTVFESLFFSSAAAAPAPPAFLAPVPFRA